MMNRKAGGKPRDSSSDEHAIARNKRARFDFQVLDTFETGICLLGSEVKSLRNGDANINESFARPRDGEIWLLGMNIKPYAQANIQNHEPMRPRKLLLHRRQIRRILGKVSERGFTLVPLKLYWKHGIAKVQLALVRGRQKFDKRQVIKKREADREMQRATRRRRRL